MSEHLPEPRCACGHGPQQPAPYPPYPAQPGAYPPPYPVYPQAYPPVPAARPWGRYIATGAAAGAVLVPVLLATTAALLAVGMAALALSITALVIRWIIRDMRRG